ncbi:SixA phosphatase family protein [Engelhardtia mirabilis]|uniref:Histidine phosphatase superfamily (Branch 1) n=1 Tax=Engelhardtia mirabilis TaxID=2528011 RepID=A0A518BJT8_9BACT|nr:Histidine phosphatase superfamily (branch 1) [Planctomycetes bacterium Pla133]QDV01565.1 Histidine phosphatase superfamily (branch 1) [Planctomycetes bacterium Pla86]
MHLHLVRHAIAAERAGAERDAARPLTAEGKRRFRKCARGLGRIGPRYDAIVHSPLLRAVESAELMAGLCDDIRVDDLLARPPGRPLFTLLSELQQQGAERLALVGHQPWLGELAAWLTIGSTEAASSLPLKKGGVIWLEGNPVPGGMVLRASIPPALLRSMR